MARRPRWAACGCCDADVYRSQDGVLVPYVGIGVDACEQVAGADGMVDAFLVKPVHFLVLFAEASSHFFDLIAERESVVYHLRELAVASVLANFRFLRDIKRRGAQHLDDARAAFFGSGWPSNNSSCLCLLI